MISVTRTFKRCGSNNVFILFIVVCLCVSLHPLISLHRLQHINDPNYTTGIEKTLPKQSNKQQSARQFMVGKGDSHEIVTVKEDTDEEKEGSLFVPGSLNLTRLETFQRCYVDPDRYRHHFGKKRHRDEVSERHKLVYVQIAKAGSSSAHRIMRKLFGDVESKIFCPKRICLERDQFHRFTFTRDPMSRFLSSFHEALIRWNRHSYLPRKGGKYDFLQKFYDLSKRERSHFVQFDHDRIIQMLEDFVRDYDGGNVPDDHLRLQVPNLTPIEEGLPHLDAIYDIENMEEEFTHMWMASTAYNSTTKNKTVGEHMYQRLMHLNISLINLVARKKICQLSALDFCCLNHRLPPECEGVVSCQWIKPPDRQIHSTLSKLAIVAVSPCPPL